MRFECRECGKRFPSSQSLGGHMRVHKDGYPRRSTAAPTARRGRGDVHNYGYEESEEESEEGEEYIPEGKLGHRILAEKKRRQLSQRSSRKSSSKKRRRAELAKSDRVSAPANRKRRKTGGQASQQRDTSLKKSTEPARKDRKPAVMRNVRQMPVVSSEDVRRQVEMAVRLYGFDEGKLAKYSAVSDKEFSLWLRGLPDQQPSQVFRTMSGITHSVRFDQVKQALPQQTTDAITSRMRRWIHAFVDGGFDCSDDSSLDFVGFLKPGRVTEEQLGWLRRSESARKKEASQPREKLVSLSVMHSWHDRSLSASALWDPFSGVPLSVLARSLCEDWGIPDGVEMKEVSRTLESKLDVQMKSAVQTQLAYWKAVHDRALSKLRAEFGKNSALVPRPMLTEGRLFQRSMDARKQRGTLARISPLIRKAGLNGTISVKLDLSQGSITLRDRFLWDVNDPGNDPCAFAKALVRDLALPAWFESKIAQSILDHIHEYHHTARAAEVSGRFQSIDPIQRCSVIRDQPVGLEDWLDGF